jgi:cell division protein FtsZ
MMAALKGIEKLESNVDSLVIIPNDNIMKIVDEKVTFQNAFRLVDEVLSSSVQGICDIVTDVADVNIDFADVKTVMSDRGIAHMGVGRGKGENRVSEAVKNAIESPLLETSVNGAKAILLNITGGFDIGMMDITEASNQVHEVADKDAIIIFGAAVREDMQDEMSVTIIATGFEGKPSQYADINKTQPVEPVQTADAEEPERAVETGYESDNALNEDSDQTIENLTDISQIDTDPVGVASDREDSWRKTLEQLQNNSKMTNTSFDIPSFLK